MKCTNHFLKPLGLIFLLCVLPLWVSAQNITVKGTVKDNIGEPVIGASVVQKGTSNGIVTDIDGNFTLNVPSNSIIVVSFIGYKAQEIPIRYRNVGRSCGRRLWADEAFGLDRFSSIGE